MREGAVLRGLWKLRLLQAGGAGEPGAAVGGEDADSVILVILSKIWVGSVWRNRRTFADDRFEGGKPIPQKLIDKYM